MLIDCIMLQVQIPDDPVTSEHQPLPLVGNNPKFDGETLIQEHGAYQTTFNQDHFKRSPQNQFKEHQSQPTSRPGESERESLYYNEDINSVPDTGSRGPRRRKRKNKYFLQDRRLLTEKYYPKEKYIKPRENYYEDSFYDDLEMAYNDPVITVEPAVETRQFTTVG